MIVWINRILKKFTHEKHCLLMFDTFSAHLQNNVREVLRKCTTTTAVIPGGCISKIQPLNVSLNKPFKAMMRHQWEAYVQEKAEQSDGRIPPPSKSDLVQWVQEANCHLNTQTDIIKKVFKVWGITNALMVAKMMSFTVHKNYQTSEYCMVIVCSNLDEDSSQMI
jgi:hypothetical protein